MSTEEPVAYAFYWPDGTLRFIIEGKERADDWKKAHIEGGGGTVVPLVPQKDKHEN
jgi:hypothetical protein